MKLKYFAILIMLISSCSKEEEETNFLEKEKTPITFQVASNVSTRIAFDGNGTLTFNTDIISIQLFKVGTNIAYGNPVNYTVASNGVLTPVSTPTYYPSENPDRVDVIAYTGITTQGGQSYADMVTNKPLMWAKLSNVSKSELLSSAPVSLVLENQTAALLFTVETVSRIWNPATQRHDYYDPAYRYVRHDQGGMHINIDPSYLLKNRINVNLANLTISGITVSRNGVWSPLVLPIGRFIQSYLIFIPEQTIVTDMNNRIEFVQDGLNYPALSKYSYPFHALFNKVEKNKLYRIKLTMVHDYFGPRSSINLPANQEILTKDTMLFQLESVTDLK